MAAIKDSLIDAEPRGFTAYENDLLDKKYLNLGEGREVPKDKFLDDQEMQQEGEEAARDAYEN